MKEVHELLLNLAKKPPLVREGGSSIRIGLRVPVVRKISKSELSFSGDSRKEVLSYWDTLWRESSYFEAMSLAIYSYQHKDLNQLETRTILKWIDRCHCWEHSDDLSKIYAHMLEARPDWIKPTLRRWNTSRNPWKRRQSVVSLLEYSSKRKKVLSFKELISFVEPLLSDDEYYVQKGVGWTLREIYNLYPARTIAFLKKNLGGVSPLAYSAATEKLEKKIKKEFNEKRKALRKS